MKIVLASRNPHKLVEISKITEKFGFELVLQSQLGIDLDVEETGTTFEENSYQKAYAVMKATGLPALADDSGIAVDALNGEPGIYSARYGFDNTLDDWGRLCLLLKNTEQVPDEILAPFRCYLAGAIRALDAHITALDDENVFISIEPFDATPYLPHDEQDDLEEQEDDLI